MYQVSYINSYSSLVQLMQNLVESKLRKLPDSSREIKVRFPGNLHFFWHWSAIDLQCGLGTCRDQMEPGARNKFGAPLFEPQVFWE